MSNSSRNGKTPIGTGLVKPWGRLVLFLLLLAGAVNLSATASQAASFLERAQEYVEKGDLDAAKIELKNALQRDPNDADARFLLGSILLREGDSAAAEKELLRAQDLGYVDEQLELMLAYSRLNQRQFDDVLAGVSDHPTFDTEIQKDLVVARGEALLGLGKFDEAGAVFDRVLEDGPHSRALTNKARIAMALNNSEQARDLLDRAIAISPDAPLLVAVDAEWHLRKQQFEAAKARFLQATELDPTRLLAYVGLIQSHVGLGELLEADRVVQSLKESQPENLLIVLQDGIVQFLRGNYQAAKIAADRVLAADIRQLQALLISGQSAYQLKQYEQARARLTDYLSQRPDDNQARVILGDSMLKLGYSREAYDTLSNPSSALPDNTDYLGVLSSAALSAGDRESGAKYLEKLAERAPNNTQVQMQLGNVRLSLGDASGAVQAFQRALELDPDRLDTYAELFTARMQQKSPDLALEVAQQIRNKFPEKAAGDTLSGIAYLSKREPEKAHDAFQRAVAKEPENPEAAGNLVNILRLEGKTDEAREVFDRVLQAHPGSLSTLLTYAELELHAGEPDRSEELWRQAIKFNPSEPQPRIDLANHYISTNRPVEALLVTEDALRNHRNSLGLLEAVGTARMNTGDRRGALKTFSQLAALAPNNPTAQQYQMWALEQNGEVTEALDAAERTLSIDPENNAARFAQVRYLATLGRLPEASAKLKGLKEDFPEDVDLLLVEGRIALAERRGSDAVAAYQTAFDQRSTNFVLLELVRALLITGQQESALKAMEDWLERYPNDLLINSGLGEAYMALGQYAAAEGQYQTILDQTPDRASALNNLAWIRMNLGEMENALDPARRAVELDSGNPEFADTLAMILLQSGEKEEALSLLQRARTADVNSSSIQFHLAQALLANGDKDGAVEELRVLLRQDKPFGEREKAEALLAKLTQ